MNASIKQLHAANANGETQVPKKAESANTRKSPARNTDSSESGQSSDAEGLLAETSEPQKTAHTEIDNLMCGAATGEDDSLLHEIAQSLSETE